MFTFNHSRGWDSSNYKGKFYIHTYPLATKKDELRSNDVVDSCREFFVRSYRKKINKEDSFTLWARKAYALFSFGRPKGNMFKNWQLDLKNGSEKGLYIMNSFEKEHKWPQTKLYQVKCTDRNITMIFFIGPRKWTTSPYLMSIWSLCVRIGHNSWLPMQLMNLDHENLVRQLAITSKTGENSDANQLSKTIKHWDPFMSLYSDLFSGQNRKYHWDISHLKGFSDRPEGIIKLVDGTTHYKALYKKYNDLRERKKTK